MKRYYLSVLLIFLFCIPSFAEQTMENADLARRIVTMSINGDAQAREQIFSIIHSLDDQGKRDLKKDIQAILKESPPVTTSIAELWLIHGIIYEIDDSLGKLEYSFIVEGTFDWNDASTLVGSTNLHCITDHGKRINIITTVATIDKSSAYLESEGRRIRLYVKEEVFKNGRKRNLVVKIDALY